MHKHTVGGQLSIGKPTPNNTVYILDKDGNPVSRDAPGFMWAGGTGVSRGYVGLQDKTADKYKPDPFSRNR